MKNLFKTWIIWPIIWGISSTYASQVITPEDAALAHLELAMTIYVADKKASPKNWDQLIPYFNIDRESRYLQRRLDQTYAFVSGNVLLYSDPDIKVVLVRTIPLQSDVRNKQGRYVIGTSGKGFLRDFIKESEIQEIFKKAGLPLPGPLPELPAVDEESGNNGSVAKAQIPTPAVVQQSLSQSTPSPNSAFDPKAINVKKSPTPFPTLSLAILVGLVIVVTVFFFIRKSR